MPVSASGVVYSNRFLYCFSYVWYIHFS